MRACVRLTPREVIARRPGRRSARRGAWRALGGGCPRARAATTRSPAGGQRRPPWRPRPRRPAPATAPPVTGQPREPTADHGPQSSAATRKPMLPAVAVRGVGAACRHPVAPAVRRVAQVRAAAHDAVRARRGSGRVACGGLAVVRRVEPVGAPLPHVAGDVVEAEAVRRVGVDRAPSPRSRRRRCCAGTCPGRRSSGARRPARARRPTGTRCRAATAGRALPLGLGRAGGARPRAVRHARRATRRARPDGRRGRRASDWGPSGWRQSAPSTCRHHGAAATARVGGKSSGSRPPNTNDQPKRSASVRWPVASTNAAKWSLVTA